MVQLTINTPRNISEFPAGLVLSASVIVENFKKIAHCVNRQFFQNYILRLLKK